MSFNVSALSKGMNAAAMAVNSASSQMGSSMQAIASGTSNLRSDSVEISEPAMAMFHASMVNQQMLGDFVVQSLDKMNQ